MHAYNIYMLSIQKYKIYSILFLKDKVICCPNLMYSLRYDSTIKFN